MCKSSFWVVNLQIHKHSYSDISFIPIYPPIFSVILKLQLYLVIMSGMLFWHPIGSVFAVFKYWLQVQYVFFVNVKLLLCKFMFLSLSRVDVDSSFIRPHPLLSSPFGCITFKLLSLLILAAWYQFILQSLCSGPIANEPLADLVTWLQ